VHAGARHLDKNTSSQKPTALESGAGPRAMFLCCWTPLEASAMFLCCASFACSPRPQYYSVLNHWNLEHSLAMHRDSRGRPQARPASRVRVRFNAPCDTSRAKAFFVRNGPESTKLASLSWHMFRACKSCCGALAVMKVVAMRLVLCPS
jgi:hypothetical protein